MNIKTKLAEDLKSAMKENNTIRKNTVQLLRATVLMEEKNKQKSLTDIEVENVLVKERNKRYDALAQFKKANRKDLIEQTEKEIFYISQYLPQPLSEVELEQIIEKEIKDTKATIKEMSTVIRHIKEQYGNRTTGKLISEIVKQKLTNKE